MESNFCRFFVMNWWGKLRFTSYKILCGDNAWYGTSTRESGFDKSQCWKPPLFPNVCPRLVNKFLMGELIDPQKNDQQRKSECHLQLSRTLGVSLNIYSKLEIPDLCPADSWDQLALPLLNSQVGYGTETALRISKNCFYQPLFWLITSVQREISGTFIQLRR